jgi:hypothetical protein
MVWRTPRTYAEATIEQGRYRLRWPDGTEEEDVVFSRTDDGASGTVVTVEDPRVRGLLAQLPQATPRMTTAAVVVDGVSDKVSGWWSLWRIALQSEEDREQRFVPLFLDDEERVLGPTAKTVWEALIAGRFTCAPESGGPVDEVLARLKQIATERGEPLFRELIERHDKRIQRERRKGRDGFAARRKALARVGLESVRQYRMRQLEHEETIWNDRLSRRAKALPELIPLCLVRVQDVAHGGRG